MTDGGYDAGYRACPSFWGSQPSSLVLSLESQIPSFEGLRILDVGCGEGKNALYLARKGALVNAYDVSDIAIDHALAAREALQVKDVNFYVGDAMAENFPSESFDVVIAYGLLHCLADEQSIREVSKHLIRMTRKGGYLVVCAFNSRLQDLAAAHPGFYPTTLRHQVYVDIFKNLQILEAHDRDLHETHPHNGIAHTHSMTRILGMRQTIEPK
ncbi:bifunctional 2-polyprenyl-6-hydroxyphenol methylase/3-demethylubiquinol 3-O-methyltransferase UbiG [Granulicella sp. L46]|uniref:class I SAM-dependent methyltransferase n=1 Tax=Granulicella sp. L46 TaxID=1641865 RepID=UPI00131BACAC|nr:class I SAM-dependent methyltransferase [Granulicella sp. L46]